MENETKLLGILRHSNTSEQWRIAYDSGGMSRLCLAVGEKGQATVEPRK